MSNNYLYSVLAIEKKNAENAIEFLNKIKNLEKNPEFSLIDEHPLNDEFITDECAYQADEVVYQVADNKLTISIPDYVMETNTYEVTYDLTLDKEQQEGIHKVLDLVSGKVDAYNSAVQFANSKGECLDYEPLDLKALVLGQTCEAQ